MTTQLDPTPVLPTIADDLAAKISTKPEVYVPGIVELAKAYESQRERIADLEDDVERLRPREAFVQELIFARTIGGLNLTFHTNNSDGLTVEMENDESGSDELAILSSKTSKRLTTALLKWSGVDGVEWKPVGACCGPAGMSVLMTDGKRVDVGTIEFAGHYEWPYGNTPTHYIPLPKPPVVK